MVRAGPPRSRVRYSYMRTGRTGARCSIHERRRSLLHLPLFTSVESSPQLIIRPVLVSSKHTNTGTVNTALNPNIPDGDIRGVQVSPDGSNVVIAGSFTSVNGSDRPGFGLARLDAATSESLSFPVNNVIRNATAKSAIYSLKSDASGVYGAGYDFGGPSPFEGGFHTDREGNIVWADG